MIRDLAAIRTHLIAALRGGQAYETFEEIVGAVPEQARFKPASGGRSAWQVVEHMRLSLEDIAEYSDNADGSYQEKDWPNEYWPKSTGPGDGESWEKSIQGFLTARKRVEDLVADEQRDLLAPFAWAPDHTLLREALLAIDHSAYHLGELVQITSEA